MKRFTSILLCICLVITMLPAGAFAQEAVPEVAVVDEGMYKNLNWCLTDDGVLTISGEGDMAHALYSYPWNDYKDQIKKVVIEDGVTSIGEEAFYDHAAIEDIAFGDDLSSIGEFAFRGCTSLTEIIIPDSVKTISFAAFISCTNVKTIELGEGVVSIGKCAFASCGAEAIVFPESVKLLDCSIFIGSPLKTITFEGDPPEAFYSYDDGGPFHGVSATLYYPCDNEKWTGEYLASLDGNLTWVGHEFNEDKVCIKCGETDDRVYSGKLNDDIIWSVEGKTLTISGKGAVKGFEGMDEAPWHEDRYFIDEIVFAEGITSVGSHIFTNLNKSVKVYFPKTLTEIKDYAFVDISASFYFLGDPPTIGEKAFAGCSYSGKMPCNNSKWYDFETKSFGGTSTWWTEWHDYDSNGVCSMCGYGEALYGNSNAGLNASWKYYSNNVLRIYGHGEMYGIYDYPSQTMPWNNSESIAYDDVRNTTRVDVDEGITSIGRCAFSGLSKLKVANIGKDVNLIDNYAFSNCKSLYEIYFYCDMPSTIGGSSFWDVNATVYYQCDKNGFTDDRLKNYGGDLTWVKVHNGEVTNDKCEVCRNLKQLDAPSITVSTSSTSGKPTVSWDAVPNANKYYVYRATSKNGTYSYMYSTTNTYYTNTNAVPGKTYYYKVKAVYADNDERNSELSNFGYVTCDLGKPMNVKVNNSEISGKPKVTWNKVKDADKYYVYRATSKTGDYTYMYSTTNNYYTNTSAVPGKTYYYKVRAVCSATEYGNSVQSDYCYITCDCASPVVTSSLNSNGKPSITWKKVDGATKYEVWRKVGENGTYQKYYTTVYTSFTNSSAKAGTRYYFKVKAICGKSSYGDSAFSNVVYRTAK